MQTYTINGYQLVEEQFSVKVEATSKEDAVAKAWKAFDTGGVAWSEGNISEPVIKDIDGDEVE